MLVCTHVQRRPFELLDGGRANELDKNEENLSGGKALLSSSVSD